MTIQTAGLAFAVLVVFVICVPLLRTRRRWSYGRLLALAIFATYLIAVAALTLLPLRFDYALVGRVASWEVIRGFINLTPGGYGMPQEQVVANILLGVPFGFGLPFVWSMSVLKVIVLGMSFSICIEALQLLLDLTGLAAPARSVDANDVILNTLGVAIGVFFFIVVGAIYRRLFGRSDIDFGLWSHFHRTLLRSGPNSAPS